MKRDKGKLFKNLIIFLIIIFLTFYIIFKDQDISQLLEILNKVDLKFVIVAVISMIMYFVCDAINIGRGLKNLGEENKFLQNIKYSLIGFFFSSVTPAASGGQPMQIYYMKKNNISIANSTITFLLNLACMQVVTISMAIVSLFFNVKHMNGVLITCFIIGITLNSMALALLAVSIYSTRVTNWLIKIAIKFLEFIRIKKLDEKVSKIEYELGKYHTSAMYIKSNKKLVIKTLLTTYVQFAFYYSISYWVYRAFGLSNYNILNLISLQSILFATVSGIPSPGAVGVSEGGFIELFKFVYTKEQISGAMLLCRCINFYAFVLISAIVVIVCSMKDDMDMKRSKVEK